jgi:hypothetical protein
MLAGAALIAPRLQLFTDLMCKDRDTGPWDPSDPDTRPDVLSVVSMRSIPCAADPVVQANVAKLLTSQSDSLLDLCLIFSMPVMALVQGILSCLTTTFWGSVRALIDLLY